MQKFCRICCQQIALIKRIIYNRNNKKLSSVLQNFCLHVCLPHVCEMCNKRFLRNSHLKEHLLTHTGEKPHICEICKKGFSTKSYLIVHLRIHTSEKSHVCKVCSKAFSKKGNLKWHLLTHTSEKPHVC